MARLKVTGRPKSVKDWFKKDVVRLRPPKYKTRSRKWALWFFVSLCLNGFFINHNWNEISPYIQIGLEWIDKEILIKYLYKFDLYDIINHIKNKGIF